MFWTDNLSGCLLSVKGTYFCQFKLKLVVKWARFESLCNRGSSSSYPYLPTCPSICLSVQTLFLFKYLLGEVRASIVVGQLHVLLTLMNLKMPLDLRKGSTRAARVCEKQPQFAKQILPSHPLPFTPPSFQILLGLQAQVPLKGAIPTLIPNPF